MLSARSISRRGEAGERLLSGLSLELPAGGRVAVRGPTGAGKSLLLRSLALLDPLDDGEVLWDGSPVEDCDVPAFRRRVLYLAQRPALFEGSVEANLEIAYSLSGTGGRFERDRAITRLDALGRGTDFLARDQSRLSGGEAQLVALVRALQVEPQVLLLDEPTAAMDPETEGAAESAILSWLAADECRAFLWVSHSSEQAARLADQTWTLRDGRLDGHAATGSGAGR